MEAYFPFLCRSKERRSSNTASLSKSGKKKMGSFRPTKKRGRKGREAARFTLNLHRGGERTTRWPWLKTKEKRPQSP